LVQSKKLKIGYWGNTNNYPFMVARAFKKLGNEIIFIVDNEQKLQRPEYRYSDITLPYPDWIKDFSPLPLWLLSNPIDMEKKNKIINLLKPCDIVVLNGYAVRFAKEIGRPNCIHLTGSDLIPLADNNYADSLMQNFMELLHEQKIITKGSDKARFLVNKTLLELAGKTCSALNLKIYSNSSYFKPKGALYNLFYFASYKNWIKKQIKKQREAIKNSFAYLYGPKGLVPSADQLFEQIGTDKKKQITTLAVDTDYAAYNSPPDNSIIKIFNIARFNWITSKSNERDFHELDFKGNDIMIKGISLFYHKHKILLDIRFVKKGRDLAESIELCKNLGINHLITWLDELTQNEVLHEYQTADILFDQLSNSVVTMGGLEGMAVGRPLIANSRPEIYEKLQGEKTAICQAKTPEEVCVWLEKLVTDKTFREQKGKESRDFVVKHFSTETLAKNIIKAYQKSITA